MNRLILIFAACLLGSCRDRHTVTGTFAGLTNDTLLVHGWQVAGTPSFALPWCDTITAPAGKVAFYLPARQPVLVLLTPRQLLPAGCAGFDGTLRGASAILYLDPGDRIFIHASVEDSTLCYRVRGSRECEAVAAAEALWRDDRALPAGHAYLPANPFDLSQERPVRNLKGTLKKFTDFRHLIRSIDRPSGRASADEDDRDVLPPDWDSLGAYYASLGQDIGRFLSHLFEELSGRRDVPERDPRATRRYAMPGMQAPPLRLPTVQGDEFTLDFGRWDCTVLHFWSALCRPCTEDFPAMKRAWDRYRDRVHFVGVCCDDPTEVRKKAVRHHALPWVNLYNDPRTNATALYGIETHPTKFVVDRSGIILVREEKDPDRFYVRLDSLMAARQPVPAR